MVSDIPSTMNNGDEISIEYKVFPKCFSESNVFLKVTNKGVLDYQNGQLIAKSAGTSIVRICDSLGKEYYSKTIEVCEYNYATNITVVLPATTMNIGETLKFRCIATPTDAEDANEITYSVNNENVAVISAPNELYAISGGRVCVTVSTSRVQRKFYITVLPKAYGIAVSSEKITVPFASEATIYGAVVPENVTPMPDLTWYVTNKNVISIKESDSNKCCIQTNGIGRAMLVCRIADSDIQKEIEVTVPKIKGCYIATSVYGSYDCAEVWTLRRFRDQYLEHKWWGRFFIKAYYSVSPIIIDVFGKHKWFNIFWRNQLDKMTKKLKRKGYEDTPYIDD